MLFDDGAQVSTIVLDKRRTSAGTLLWSPLSRYYVKRLLLSPQQRTSAETGDKAYYWKIEYAVLLSTTALAQLDNLADLP